MNPKITSRAAPADERKEYKRYQLVTFEDLDQFRTDLVKELKQLLTQKHSAPEKPWLKSSEVRKLLQISPGTLQSLRDNGTLRFTKIGGIIYYEYEDIKRMMDKSK